MRTSETVAERGLYASECCGEEVVFDEGATFCRCTKCEGLCEWELVETVVPWTELEEVQREAA